MPNQSYLKILQKVSQDMNYFNGDKNNIIERKQKNLFKQEMFRCKSKNLNLFISNNLLMPILISNRILSKSRINMRINHHQLLFNNQYLINQLNYQPKAQLAYKMTLKKQVNHKLEKVGNKWIHGAVLDKFNNL